jgi:hypothetical protein
MMMQELGWDPEWEVNPKELKLIEKIGEESSPLHILPKCQTHADCPQLDLLVW